MSNYDPLLSPFISSLPDTVTFNYWQYATGQATSGSPSYFDVEITGINTLTGKFDAWCIDTDRFIEQKGTLTAKVYSTYEPLPTDLLGQSTLPIAPAGFGNIEYPQNFDLLNWIINQNFVGKTLLDSNGNNLGAVTYGDVQRAIWSLIDNQNSTTNLGSYSQARADRIQALAQANGENFVPSFNYTTMFGEQVTGQVGVILIPDSNGFDDTTFDPVTGNVSSTTDANPFDRQFMIIGVKLAKLGDFVFADQNANGIQDTSEQGISGVTVKLLNSDTGELVATTTTNASGLYSFEVLPGNYKVEFTKPTGYDALSPVNQGADDTKDSDANLTTLTTGVITLKPGDNNTTNDAGFYKFASLGDKVWEDINQNGQQDTGEAGISNVTVELYKCVNNAPSGAVLATQLTDANGNYSFTGLAPGDYIVKFITPNGYVQTTANVGNDASDSDAGTGGLTGCYTLASGQTNNTVDAGFYKPIQPATIGDKIWEDINGNGQQDTGEAGISNVTVELYTCVNNQPGVFVASTTTNAEGNYNFTGLEPGDYIVKFITPSGYVQTTANVGNDTSDSDAGAGGLTGCYNLVSGQTDNSVDAGFYKPASLGDKVWEDINQNGQQDAGEAGISNVTVELYTCVNNQPGVFVASTTTNAEGNYNFTGLEPGDYIVKFITPSGYVQTTANVGNDTSDSDAGAGGLTGCYNLVSGQTDNSVDAGFYRPATIGDRVFVDANNNGQQDAGEVGQPGVTVELYTCVNDRPGTLITSTTTDASGNYSFSGLAPGDYIVKFVTPNGFSLTTANVGADATDSDAGVGGFTGCYTLSSGETNTTVDAGLTPLASLGDRVFEDKNANGIQDAGEAGIAGATVNLLSSAGTVIGTTTTDANGLYSFTGLLPGDYKVQFVKPTGFDALSPANQGSNDAIDSDADPTTLTTGLINLSPGENDPTNDAGFYKFASLGDRVFSDTNANGIQDAGEAGVGNVTVRLINPTNGNVIATTTTNAEGLYSFTGLTPGNYQVEFVKPDGTTFSPADQGGNDATDSDANVTTGRSPVVTLTSGENNTTVDAGLTPQLSVNLTKYVRVDPVTDCPTGPMGTAIVDTNNDGIADSGINLGNLTKYLFFFANGSTDANWQGATKGFAGDVVVDGIQANERTSGGVPYAGTIYTNDSTLGAWQNIVNQNAGQASVVTGQTALVSSLENDLNNAFSQINSLSATTGFTSVVATSLDGLNTQDGVNNTYVINVTSGFQVSSKINITGDAGDVFVMRWDSDANAANGYQGQVKFQSGGAIVPLGGLTAGNFIHVAGDINASGGGSNPASPFPQGPRLDDGLGNLIDGGSNFNGGGFFTGYWLTTGDPTNGDTASLSNGIFVGGWYTLSDKFSMTSGTSGVHVCPNEAALPAVLLSTDANFNPNNIGSDANVAPYPIAALGDKLTYTYQVDNTSSVVLNVNSLIDDNATSGNGSDDFTPIAVLKTNGFNFGDTNNNGAFDPGESWYYQAMKYATTAGTSTNSATVQVNSVAGSATDTDIATVQIGQGGPVTASLGDFLWFDTNKNGLQDADESGVGGQTITLIGGGADGLISGVGDTTQTTTTRTDGFYQFTGLTPGVQYQVQFSKPANTVFTLKDANGNTLDNLDSDVDPTTGKTQIITLAAGENNSTLDAGIYSTASGTGGIKIIKDVNQQFAAPNTPVTYTYSVSNTGNTALANIKVTDDNATPNFTDDDFNPTAVLGANGKNIGDINGDNLLDVNEVWKYSATVVPPVVMTVTPSAGGPTYDSGMLSYKVLDNGDIRIFYRQDNNFNDNTYGTGSDAGWTSQGKTHKFGDLTGSDKAGFEVRATDGTILFKFYQDYLTSSSNNLDGYSSFSGYESLGISGGDGKLESGGILNAQAATFLKDFDSTLELNLNRPGYTTTIINSPVGDPNWDVVNGYYFTIDKAAFTSSGKTFGGVKIFDQHNSPAKTGGSNSYIPDIVSGVSVNTATVTGTDGTTTVTSSDNASVTIVTGPLGSIGDRVWFDTNANGVQDTGEAGISGVKLTLTGDFNNDGFADYTATTTTGANGIYNFGGLAGGAYKVTVDTATLPNYVQTYDLDGLATANTANATLTAGQNRVDVDFGYVASAPGFSLVKTATKTTAKPFEPVTYTYQVSNTGNSPLSNIVIKDDNGTPTDAADDFIPTFVSGDTNGNKVLDAGETWQYTSTVTPPVQLTANNVNGYTGPAGMLTSQVLANGDIRITYRQNTGINDNTYGTGSDAGWAAIGKTHTFSNLTGSDKAGFLLKDSNGNDVMQFYMDYITAASTQDANDNYTAYSGYRSLGVTGGDGSISLGSASNLYDFDSTLELNLNRPGYTTTIVNSPVGDPNWDVVNGYSFTVKAAAFGSAGFGSVSVFDQHNSPSKLGVNSFAPTIAGSPVTNIATVTATINGSTVVAVDDATVNISVPTSGGGTGTGGTDVYKQFGAPTSMTFTYIGGSVISTGGKDKDGDGLGDQDGNAKIESGAPDNDNTAYIVVSETSNVADIKSGSKKVYFGGTVQIGQSFSASLDFANEDKFQNDTRILIFEDEAAFIAGANPLEVIKYKTDGSQPITIGDKIAGVQLAEYQGANNGYDNPSIDPLIGQVNSGFSLTGLFGNAQQLTFRYDASIDLLTGGKTNNQDGKAQILGTRTLDDDGTSFIRVSDKSNPNDLGGKEYFEDVVGFGQEFMASVSAPGASTDKFGANTYIHYFDDRGGTYLGSVVYKTDGSQPIQLNDRLSGSLLVGFEGINGSAMLP